LRRPLVTIPFIQKLSIVVSFPATIGGLLTPSYDDQNLKANEIVSQKDPGANVRQRTG